MMRWNARPGPNALALTFLAIILIAASALPAASAGPVTCTVILDAATGERLHREGACDAAVSPMSTFKIPLAVMGYDAGVLIDEKSPLWDYQPAYDRPKRERKSTDPTTWERDSIVWYSQELARRLGRERFGRYVEAFGYGNRDVSGGPGGQDGLAQSWLMSSLRISPDGQVDFLRRLLNGGLPVSDVAVNNAMAIMPRFEAAGGWTIHGKTGSGWLRDASGKVDRGRPLGWFVGWADGQGRRVVFARLLVDTRSHDAPISFATRDGLVADLPKILAVN